MTALTDFRATIRGWLNVGDAEYGDAVVDSWITMATESLGEELRVKHMLQIDTAEILVNRVLLPSDWIDVDLIRVVDGDVLKFRTREQFYEDHSDDENYNAGYCTISGNYLILGSNYADDSQVEIHYMQTIPALSDANWLYTYHYTLYLMATLVAAMLYGVEDERAAGFKAMVEEKVSSLNAQYIRSQMPQGQSLVQRKTKGFG